MVESVAVIHRLPDPSRRREIGRRAKQPPAPPAEPPISNMRLAMVVLLVAETMFFSGLIGAYLVFRGSAPMWPPPTLPRLPLGVTWVNTLVLVASGVIMIAAVRAARRDDQHALRRNLAVTGALGLVFLAVQGSEWARLIGHGLTMSTGMFGATFYFLIGTHAAHVVCAIAWVGLVGWWAHGGRFAGGKDTAVEACAIYWVFVCALWLALFALVYR